MKVVISVLVTLPPLDIDTSGSIIC